jgi:SAM-dependent methyltransferase
VSTALGTALAAELAGRATLEVGVGTARIAAPLVERGIALVGVDLSRPMLRRAVEKGLRAGVVADGAHLPFCDHAFDAAMTVHVTHLLADWPHVLGEIARVTRTEYLSVIEGPTPRRRGPASEYYRSLQEEGVLAAHPGLHEWRLAEQLPPDRWRPVIEYDDRTSTEALFHILERRQWSNQWKVPEGAHRRALEAARARFPTDTEIVTPTRLRIAIWSVARLAAHVSRQIAP